MLLALPMGDSTPTKIFSGFALHESYCRMVEPAGHIFEEIVRQKFEDPFFEEEQNEDEEENETQVEDTIEYEWEKEYKESQNENKAGMFSVHKENFYQILGIDDLFLNAKQEDIRKAYKKLAVLYHPDKNQENISLEGVETSEKIVKDSDEKPLTEEEKKKREINLKWLKIKEAYETLIEPEKRKKYDSTIEFDDTIPEDIEKYEEKEFFRAFGPVFLKNSIWSKKKPVPKIGDMSTPIDKVRKFYKFWYNFQSWRDFSVEGEYNVEEAGSRYEKRQMVKENKKMKANLIKEEKGRITKLCQLAYKHDPRIIAEEEKERKIREDEKRERLLQKEKEKKEQEERIKQLQKEHEEAMKKKKEMQAKEKEQLTNQIVELGKVLDIVLSSEEKFLLDLNSKIETLKEVIEKCNAISDKLEKKRTYVDLCKNFFAMKIRCEDLEKEKSNGATWTKEEIILLQKGVKRFPAGTKNRWDKIKEIVKTKENEDIIQMTHYLSANPGIKIEGSINLAQIMKKEKEKKAPESTTQAAKAAPAQDVWTAEEQKLLEEGLKKYPSTLPPNERWTNIAKLVPGKTKKQCVDRYKYIASLLKKKNK